MDSRTIDSGKKLKEKHKTLFCCMRKKSHPLPLGFLFEFYSPLCCQWVFSILYYTTFASILLLIFLELHDFFLLCEIFHSCLCPLSCLLCMALCIFDWGCLSVDSRCLKVSETVRASVYCQDLLLQWASADHRLCVCIMFPLLVLPDMCMYVLYS